MPAIVNKEELKFCSAYAVGVGAISMVGILGARYVSILPKLPLKAALIAGGSTFIVGIGVGQLHDYLDPSIDMDFPLIVGAIISGAAFATCGKFALSEKNVSIGTIVSMSFIENMTGYIFAIILMTRVKINVGSINIRIALQ